MTMTKDDFIAEVYEIAFGDNAINRNFTFDEVIEELKKFSDNALAFEDECLAHPPYYCDGGCGKIVGDGYDDECKRICSLCEVTTDDVYYNYYICNHCFKIHSDPDAIDCKYCGRKLCVMLYQATNKKNAIKEARQ